MSDSAISSSVACQAPLSMEFPRQEYYSGFPFPSLGDHSDLGIEPASPMSPALAGGFFTVEPPGSPTQMFKETLFRTIKTWRQPKRFSTCDGINYVKSVQQTIIQR